MYEERNRMGSRMSEWVEWRFTWIRRPDKKQVREIRERGVRNIMANGNDRV
jgi:hypothetical protein